MKTFDAYQTATLADGRAILARIMSSLFDSPDAYYPKRGAYVALTQAQLDNWDARDTVLKCASAITAEIGAPVSSVVPYVDALPDSTQA